jgi:hypothetical protein
MEYIGAQIHRVLSSTVSVVTETTHKLRRSALHRAEAWLRTQTSPRLHMALIVSATGAAALLFSFLMLRMGLGTMWIRYPLAVGLAYLFFGPPAALARLHDLWQAFRDC